MNSNFVTEFVNNLIKKTLSGDIKWRSLENVSTIDDTPISDILSQDEFHTIYYYESYFCAAKQGMIFLVSEKNESGRDGRVSEGYNLYLRPGCDHPLSSVMFDTNELYRLKNAIELKRDVAEDVVDFMKSFLEGQD